MLRLVQNPLIVGCEVCGHKTSNNNPRTLIIERAGVAVRINMCTDCISKLKQTLND